MAKIEINVGHSLEEVGTRFIAAWETAETAPDIKVAGQIHFQDWAALCAVLTPKRYELLRHLRASPKSGVRALARALHRDVKRVHEDVVALAELGLVDREEGGGLSSSVDEITSTIRIAA